MNACNYNMMNGIWLHYGLCVIQYVTKYKHEYCLKQTSKILNFVILLENFSTTCLSIIINLVIDMPSSENLYKIECYVITIFSLPLINKTTGKLCVCLYSYQHKTCTLLRSTMQQPTQNIIATIDFVGLEPKKWPFWPPASPIWHHWNLSPPTPQSVPSCTFEWFFSIEQFSSDRTVTHTTIHTHVHIL